MRAAVALVVLALGALEGGAVAAPPLKLVIGAPQPPVADGELGGTTIFLNRCVGGCTVRPGPDNSETDTSPLTQNQTTLAEFTFQPGEWEATVACAKEVYSPYNVNVTDTRPTAGQNYTEILVAGDPADLGLPNGVGGVASVPANCQPNVKGVSFAFTSAINIFAQEAGGSRVNGLCWIIAQETAHLYGLDHEYEFAEDARSACNDPMTYRADCGGQKFFRNRFAKCGESEARACNCPGYQNSHAQMVKIFGAGQSIVPAPTVSVTTPLANGALGAVVVAAAGSKRGVERVDFYLNGWKWSSQTGVAFTRQGQPDPSSYTFVLPTNLPDSIYDIVVKAYDDIGTESVSDTVTVTKGAACQSAATCANGQKCENGRCFWDPPVGEIGDDCTYAEFCKSNLCSGTADTQICTQNCIPGVADSCPIDSGLECAETSPGHGVCFPKDTGGGCCSVNGDGNGWVPGTFGAVVFGLIALRPRRRRS